MTISDEMLDGMSDGELAALAYRINERLYPEDVTETARKLAHNLPMFLERATRYIEAINWKKPGREFVDIEISMDRFYTVDEVKGREDYTRAFLLLEDGYGCRTELIATTDSSGTVPDCRLRVWGKSGAPSMAETIMAKLAS